MARFGVLPGMSPWLSDLFLSSQSDERLIALVREGRERAFAVIVERYRRELLALARRLRSDGRAEDLVQQTFLSAFTAISSGAEVTHLRGWLYQILRNASTSAGRRSHVEVELDGAMTAGEALEEAVERRMLACDALAEVAALPERQRDALVATAIHGRSRASVAKSMGLTEGAVRQLMHRARVSLRNSITAITPWPLARWLTAARPGGAGSGVTEIVAGAGTASVGGVAAKLGAIVATGVVATGIVSSHSNGHHSKRPASAARSTRTAAPSQAGAGVTASAGATAGTLRVVTATLLRAAARAPERSGGDGSGRGGGSHSNDQGTGSSDRGGGPSRNGGDRSSSSVGSGDGSGSPGGSDGASSNASPAGGGSVSDGGSAPGGGGSDGLTSTAVAASETTPGPGDGGTTSASGDTTSGTDGGSGGSSPTESTSTTSNGSSSDGH
ncbi:MAG TPA: sigma-70 family RNA polymerase sigma factor [Solirubrobacteraceae bacterium]|nr:sigma-70 family RNA polymerase sigma factor [Solirubrobacteraceae bacterium]